MYSNLHFSIFILVPSWEFILFQYTRSSDANVAIVWSLHFNNYVQCQFQKMSSSSVYELLSRDNIVFKSYAFWGSVLILKTLAMSILTGLHRFRTQVSNIPTVNYEVGSSGIDFSLPIFQTNAIN